MAYDVTLTGAITHAVFDLRGAADVLAEWCGDALPLVPGSPGSYVTASGCDLAWIGPDHWLLIAPLAREEALLTALRPDTAPPDVSLVRVSDTLAFFSISGRDAPQILSIASPLDLHPSVFPDTGATFTEAFGLRALVLRRPGGIDLAVERSYGDMIDTLLRRAAGQTGAE